VYHDGATLFKYTDEKLCTTGDFTFQRRILSIEKDTESKISCISLLSNAWTPNGGGKRYEGGLELSTLCRQFKLKAPDGKMRETDCSDVEGLFRIIQSIPSPKGHA